MKRIVGILLLVWMLISMVTSCGFTVPRPEINECEFDFSVTYEFNGEIKTVSGVYVCKYDGIDWSLEGGYRRAWAGYVKYGTPEEVILLETAEDGGEIELNLCFDPGYFMGDSHWKNEEPFTPIITVKLVSDGGLCFENNADIIAETYGAKIISYEYNEPIENSFN